MKRKVLSLLMIVVFLFTTNTNGYVANNTRGLTYWFSNADRVGRWKQTPKVFKLGLGNNHFTSAFDTAINHARTQWSAAGVPVTSTGVATSADIVCLGGTNEEIYIYSGTEIQPGITGLMQGSSVFDHNEVYGGSTKQVRRMVSKAYVYIVNLNRDLEQYKKTGLHEMGHALGWFGHSASDADVMWAYATSITTLTFRDKKQLTQVTLLN